MIIFGGRASTIARIKVPNIKCNHCENDSTFHLSVFGKYGHIFWIPLFPTGKKAVAECTHCLKTIEQRHFPADLKKAYFQEKKDIKTPLWHWAGLGFVGIGLFLIIALIVLIGVTHEPDPRAELYKIDEESLLFEPEMEDDSISYKIKRAFDAFANEDVSPSDFMYLTRVKEDKALILMQIPELRHVEKEARKEALEVIEMVTSKQADLVGKDLYIGVKGVFSIMLIKTPTEEFNSRLALESSLYDFYGPKPETTEE